MKVTPFKMALFTTWLCATPQLASAHFGMIIPSSNTATQAQKDIDLSLSFSHPFELHGMDMEKPKQFGVMVNNQKTDLSASLTSTKIMDHESWKTNYAVKRPGVYQFYMEPKPYWEPAEDLFIIHYTKTIVAAYGADTDWDVPVGLPVEIIPLTRPFGNYAGNSFTGQVLVNGEAAPQVEVEIEFYNYKEKLIAPSDYHITQVVKTDNNGTFSFTTTAPGWWGFSALTEADYTLPLPDGTEKGVETGGVLWLYFDAVSGSASK